MQPSHDPQSNYNPYAPPSPFTDLPAAVPDVAEDILAQPSTRLGARILDGLMLFAACVPSAFLAWSFTSRIERGVEGMRDDVGAGVLMVLVVMVPLALCIYQWMLIARLGQTLGKKWLGIKIVKLDGSPAGFVYGVLLRNWVLRAGGAIPYIGWLISLADTLMIFGAERRCLHDQIAGTKVVLVLGVPNG